MERALYSEIQMCEDTHWWYVARRRILNKVLKGICKDRIGSTILEAGCGSGGNLEMLSSFGTVHAMEMDDESREIANRRKICQVKKGSLPDEIPYEGGFDLICLLDVLEHIEDDLATLKTLSSQLTPGGHLLVTVPAYQFLWSQHDVINHHKRRYTKSALRKLVSESGLRSVYTTYFNFFLFAMILTTRMFHKLFRRKTASDLKLPSRAINHALTRIFGSERYLVPWIALPVGVSILLVAQKVA